jgi:spore germination protein
MKTFRSVLAGLFISGAIISFWFSHQATQAQEIETLSTLTPITKSKSIFAYFLHNKPTPKKIIFGYLPYWSVSKIKFLQTDKLTDIAYFGLRLNADGTFFSKTDKNEPDPGYDYWHNDKDLADYIKYAQKNGVRVSLTVISHDDEISDKFLDCESCWVTLFESLKNEMKIHNVSDVNMNFEYVDFQDKEKRDKYTKLIQYLNTELDKTYGSSYFTVATFADSFVQERVTDVESLGKIADGLFIMAYDFHNVNSDNAGPGAPLSGKGDKWSYDLTTMTADYLRVVPPNKILLGIPYYGINYVVENTNAYAKRIPNDDDDLGEDEKNKSQTQAYSDVMNTISELNPHIYWDDSAKTPYFTYKSPETGALRQVFYEDEKSIAAKFDLVDKNGLGGIGIWALGYDGGYQELWGLIADKFFK